MDDKILPIIDLDRCNGCGLCAQLCPTHAVEMIDARPAIVRVQDCAYCGMCEEMCPVEAIGLVYEIVLPPHSESSPGK